MRTDLDHLPYAVQEELDHATHILFEEFAEAMSGKQAAHRKAGRILKLILFGAFADPDWNASETGESIVAFDILVVVNHEELADAHRYWRFAIDRLYRGWQGGTLRRPVRLTLSSLAAFNGALVNGVPFFTAIAEGGVALYRFSDRPLATPRHMADAERHARARRAFDKWFPKGRAFLAGARFFRDAGQSAMAALLLHQACEHLYQCVLYTVTLHGRRTHALHELRDLAEQRDNRLRAAWPGNTRFERRAFGCIRRAYVEARYGDHYRIAADELAWAIERVEALLMAVASICAEHLGALQPPTRALVPFSLPSGWVAAASRRSRSALPQMRRVRPGFRWNRLRCEGRVRPDVTRSSWPRWWELAVFIAIGFEGGFGVSTWVDRHYVQTAQVYDFGEPHQPADPTAILDFNIRAATVLEAVGGVAERAGYRLQSNDALWEARWTGAYRAKATTFDALSDILYGTELCPVIRDDLITVRQCQGGSKTRS
ncbi:HEPN domain-containing protein [Sphingomonas abietis]|uniref:HEPN domain-containing protein n=1 Tax=Sphingomonas abietis TaxID=3012344 RepID=A0ABY7NVP4_9SPHN|nr:HEPN domain-containing protein [Sphingomonas abietis]WBO24496.1 HEPN domain-containing protein [Sphingomonas abietis]